MTIPSDKKSRPAVELTPLDLITFEIFPHDRIQSVNHTISEYFRNTSPSADTSKISENQQFNWELSDRTTFFEKICKPENFPDSGFTSNIFEDHVDTVEIVGLELDWTPFYVVELRIKVKPSFFDGIKLEEYGGYLGKISHPIRLFMHSFKGMMDSSSPMKPSLPLITRVAGTVSEDQMIELRKSFDSKQFQSVGKSFNSHKPSISTLENENPLFPFVLETQSVLQNRSVIDLASNVILLLGFSNQIALYGHRTVYYIVLTTTPDLIQRNPIFDVIGLGLPRGSADELFFQGSTILASVIALNGWLQFKEREFSELEKDTNVWRNRSEKREAAKTIEDLNYISSIGLRASSFAADLGFMKRVFAQGLEKWQSRNDPNTNEVDVSGEGPLHFLAKDTIQHLDRLINYVSAIRSDIDWMVRNVSIFATMSTNDNIVKLTGKTTRYTRWVMFLTGVLILLSTLVIILPYYGL